MARVVDAKYSTLIGTAEQIRDLLGVLAGGPKSATVVDLKFSNFVVTANPVDAATIARAMEATPRKQKA